MIIFPVTFAVFTKHGQMSITGTNPLSILLTGGSGFLGRFMVEELLAPDSPVNAGLLRIFDLEDYKGPADDRIEMVRGSILDEAAVTRACKGIDAVIHSAAIVDWGTHPGEEVYAVNFTGTKILLDACRKTGVKHFIFTSSLDAIYTGRAMRNIDESVPYPARHPNMYCRSKAMAEQLVIEANSETLTTCVLRPADIWGPGDPFHIGSLINMAKGGFYVRLGDGKSLSQHVYAGNVAHAHALAIRAMTEGNGSIAGNVYFITDGPPANFFTFFDAIVEGIGYRIRPKNLWIPKNIAYGLGAMTEVLSLLVRPFIRWNPGLSRFAVMYTCGDFTFTSDKAARDFGFTPKYEGREAFNKTVGYYRNM